MAVNTRQKLREYTVKLLRRKWTLRIATALSDGTKRHSEIAKYLPSIKQNILTKTLDLLFSSSIVVLDGTKILPLRTQINRVG